MTDRQLFDELHKMQKKRGKSRKINEKILPTKQSSKFNTKKQSKRQKESHKKSDCVTFFATLSQRSLSAEILKTAENIEICECFPYLDKASYMATKLIRII